jgi:ParB/RepB/Spo0J family partition protein
MTEQWDINLIHPDPENLRRDTKADKDLVASVKALGIIEPLIVVAEDDGVGAILVAGARRLDAAKQAGLKVVPVVVREYTAEQRTMVMLVENLRRVDLDPIEEATGYVRLVGMGMTKKDLATQVGRTQAHVTARMKPQPQWQELVEEEVGAWLRAGQGGPQRSGGGQGPGRAGAAGAAQRGGGHVDRPQVHQG